MSKLGNRLLKAAQEGRSIARGEADKLIYRVHVPTDEMRETSRSAERTRTDQLARRCTRRTR
jgi:hypothetical protein